MPITKAPDAFFVSLYGTDTLGISLHKDGDPRDADGNLVTVTMRDASNTIVFTRNADHGDTGKYQTGLLSTETAAPGLYSLTWSYSFDGSPEEYVTWVQVGESAPAYDALSDGYKVVVENVYFRFDDLFDSENGGPHLQFYFQTHFGRQRMAQLLRVALNKLNNYTAGRVTYSLEQGGKEFPISQWGGILEQALYIETIKHLRRSYVEQPDASGVNVGRLDRRDYLDRWGEILNDETREFETSLDFYRIANMGLGRPKVLVSGGVYGSYGPTRLSHSAAARPRYWSRFY